jgi:hypothetical protein
LSINLWLARDPTRFIAQILEINKAHFKWPDGQGCQMAYFQTENPYLGKFWWGLAVEDVGICILWPLGQFSGHWVYVMYGHVV